ncbi:hypothetical protein [Lacinutrix sp.]
MCKIVSSISLATPNPAVVDGIKISAGKRLLFCIFRVMLTSL